VNRRDFLKLTAWFSIAPAAVLASPREPLAATLETAGRLRFSTSMRNAALDAVFARTVYFAICSAATKEIIGITKIKVPPAAKGQVVFGGFTIDVVETCRLGKAQFLDADEVEILSFLPNYTSNLAAVGSRVSITGVSLR
jgi:hypothetical protein